MKSAFSLIELLIVIIILGMLMAFVLPSLTGKAEEAKDNITCSQMGSLAQALKIFKIDNSRYPTSDEGLRALITNPNSDDLTSYAKSAYLEDKKLPTDPWKKEYIYIETENSFDLISFGSNKQEGGGDDIYYSKCNK
jgi:general secretion pathway protein G